MKRILFVGVLLFFSILSVYGQQKNALDIVVDSTKTYKVFLKDGTMFLGSIVSSDSSKIVLKSSSTPRLEVKRNSIQGVSVVTQRTLFGKPISHPNIQPYRYFISNSGFNPPQGELCYQNSYLLINSFNYALTDYLSIGAGFEFITTFLRFSEKWTPIVFLSPKLGFDLSENWHLGGGLFWLYLGPFSYWMDDDEIGFNLEYATLTYGNRENNISLGTYTSLMDGKVQFKDLPISVSGMLRIGRSVSFVSENFLFDLHNSTHIVGLRLIGQDVLFDLGLIYGRAQDDLLDGLNPSPYADLVLRF